MRAGALKQMKLLMYAGLCVSTAAAHARPKPAARPAAGHGGAKAHAAQTAVTAKKGVRGVKAEVAGHEARGRHARVEEEAAPAVAAKRRRGGKVVEADAPARGKTKRGRVEEAAVKGRGRRAQLEEVAEVRHGRAHGRAVEASRAASAKPHAAASRLTRAEAAQAESAEAEDTHVAEAEPAEAAEPTVHHNRKVHHAAGAVADESEVSPAVRPIAFRAGGRVHMPPAMKGSHEILIHQNEMADEEGLQRVQDDADLMRMRARRELVALPASGSLAVDERLPENRRFARPWVATFLTDVARAHAARFGGALQVNSAVRTVDFQVRLMRTNGNAAPAEGDTASPHLTGQAVDLAKHGLSAAEIGWMREYLMPMVAAGKIDVEEEFQQACFHISVYRSYAPGAGQPRQGAPVPVVRIPTVLAAAMP